MSDSNNGHANGTGKAFVLAQPKTPEEIRRENTKRMLPEMRRNCSRDPRLQKFVGAKWLFGQLTDLTFLHMYGGDANGKVYINIRDLNRIYGHDRNTLTRWLKKLVETGWIWMREMWPKTEIGICGVTDQPELFVPHMDYTRQMARSEGVQEPANPPGMSKIEENSQFGGTEQPSLPVNPARLAEGSSQTGFTAQPEMPVEPAREVASEPPKGSQEPAKVAARRSQSGGINVASVAARRSHIKETPVGEGSSGALRGDIPPPKAAPEERLEEEFAAWCVMASDLLSSKQDKLRSRLDAQRQRTPRGNVRDFLTRKIAFLDQLRDGPLPPADEPTPKTAAPTPQTQRQSPEAMLSLTAKMLEVAR